MIRTSYSRFSATKYAYIVTVFYSNYYRIKYDTNFVILDRRTNKNESDVASILASTH